MPNVKPRRKLPDGAAMPQLSVADRRNILYHLDRHTMAPAELARLFGYPTMEAFTVNIPRYRREAKGTQ